MIGAAPTRNLFLGFACAATAVFALPSPGRADLITIGTAAGMRITVSSAFAPRILPFISDLVASGYTPRVIHCHASGGHVARSRHYSGSACDFDQRGWGKTAGAMYHVREIAMRYSLRDGCSFRDCGHIDDGGGSRLRRANAGRNGGHHRYASRHHRPSHRAEGAPRALGTSGLHRALAAHTESGVASIYSVREQGSRTASGRPLLDSALTAAHKSLPFGTVLRVTNSATGRAIHVVVTDRGPFVRGRILDLTPAGARNLGFSGLARVHTEIVHGVPGRLGAPGSSPGTSSLAPRSPAP